MPSLYRLAEVVIYSILNFLPFLLLALYPFRKHLRFSVRTTTILILLLTLCQLAMGVWAAFFSNGHAALVSAVSTLIYAAFYFYSVKVSFGKMLFTLLMLSNIANFIVVASKCLEGQLFPEMALESYRWSASLMILLVDVIFLVPLFFYIKIAYTPAVEKEPSGIEWRYLWLIPATFYLIWYNAIYYNAYQTSLEIALDPGNSILFFFINCGAVLIYYVVSKLIREQNKNIELETKNYMLAMQTIQYKTLQEKIAEARQAKHDVRHHITLIREYLNHHKYMQLDEYMSRYQASLSDNSLTTFCRNTAANTIISYFSQLANDNDIEFSVNADIPEDISISGNDLSVILGNLLENAVQACSAQTSGKRKIVVRGDTDASSLCLTIDNTFSGDIKLSNGIFQSTKHQGAGIGIESVKNIVNQNSGTLLIDQKDGMFRVSVLL